MKNMRQAKNELSKGVINYLHDTFGDNYRTIGEKIGLSETFISRVRHGKRNLSLEHLTRIESAYKKPLPVILLEAAKDKNILKELRPFYKFMREMLLVAKELERFDL